MRIAILHNHDFTHIPPGVERASQDAVLGVAAAVETALRSRGAQVQVLPVASDPLAFTPEFLKRRPELVINLCESLGGDARGEMLVPGLLDLIGVSYTGSGPLALALALHKHKAKEVLRARGVPTPAAALVRNRAEVTALCTRLPLKLPVIVKPAHEDASIGIDSRSVVRALADLAPACHRVLDGHAQPALVEEYIEGREIYVPLLGEPAQPLPLSEIDYGKVPAGAPRILTYNAKWDPSSAEYLTTPAVACELPAAQARRVEEVARAAFQALECRDYGRVDMRLAADGTPYVIEVNPNCDLSPDAGFARAAGRAGLSYEQLVWRLVEVARSRTHAPEAAQKERPGAARANARPGRRLHGSRGGLRPRAGRSGT